MTGRTSLDSAAATTSPCSLCGKPTRPPLNPGGKSWCRSCWYGPTGRFGQAIPGVTVKPVETPVQTGRDRFTTPSKPVETPVQTGRDRFTTPSKPVATGLDPHPKPVAESQPVAACRECGGPLPTRDRASGRSQAFCKEACRSAARRKMKLASHDEPD